MLIILTNKKQKITRITSDFVSVGMTKIKVILLLLIYFFKKLFFLIKKTLQFKESFDINLIFKSKYLAQV